MPSGTVTKQGESVTMDNVYHHVITGDLHGFYTEDTDLDTGENLDTLIVTGKDACYLTLEVDVFGGQVIADIYEDVETSVYGTEIRASRFNRIIPNTRSTKIYNAPTITNIGELFVRRRVLSFAQGVAAIQTSLNLETPRVLKPYTKYLLRQTAVSDNIAITLVGRFYEE